MPERSLPSATPEVADATPRFSLRTKLVAIAGIAGTLIGAAGIIVPLVASAGTRASSVDTIQVDAQGGGGGTTVDPASLVQPLDANLASQALGATVDEARVWSGHYAVPVDAPWEELWALQPEYCYGDEMIQWLETNGVPIPWPSIMTVITNTATSGSPVTIRNVRLQGTVTPPAGETVRVTYPTCVGDEIPGIYGNITVGVDPVAVYDQCYNPDAYGTGVRGCRVGEGDVPPVPGDPLVFDIYPGGTQQLNLSFDQVADFTGRFVADVEVDGQVSVLDLTEAGPDIVSPTVTRDAFLSFGSVESTQCRANDESEVVMTCTLEQWLAMLAD